MKNKIYYIVSTFICVFVLTYANAQDVLTSDITDPTEDFDCFDGAINLHINGGFAPYDFVWSNDATTEDIQECILGIITGNPTLHLNDLDLSSC